MKEIHTKCTGLCRVILPDGSTTVVPTCQTETIKEVVTRLLDKRALRFSNYDVLVLATDEVSVTFFTSGASCKNVTNCNTYGHLFINSNSILYLTFNYLISDVCARFIRIIINDDQFIHRIFQFKSKNCAWQSHHSTNNKNYYYSMRYNLCVLKYKRGEKGLSTHNLSFVD